MWSKLKEQFNLLKLEKKRLYLIASSDDFNSKDEFLDAIASALQGGVDILQLREKNIPDSIIVDLGNKIRILCDEFGATFIINDRLDIAQIVEADGVHLGRNDISIHDAREVLGANAIIGQTVSCREEISKAVAEGADYISLGPVASENSKLQNVVNMELVYLANENSKVPVFQFGIMEKNCINELTYNGAKRLIVSDEVMRAKSPEQAARKFLSLLP